MVHGPMPKCMGFLQSICNSYYASMVHGPKLLAIERERLRFNFSHGPWSNERVCMGFRQSICDSYYASMVHGPKLLVIERETKI
jgi:hypothetical protein